MLYINCPDLHGLHKPTPRHIFAPIYSSTSHMMATMYTRSVKCVLMTFSTTTWVSVTTEQSRADQSSEERRGGEERAERRGQGESREREESAERRGQWPVEQREQRGEARGQWSIGEQWAPDDKSLKRKRDQEEEQEEEEGATRKRIRLTTTTTTTSTMAPPHDPVEPMEVD